MYAKLTNGAIEYEPNLFRCGEQTVINPTAEMLTAEGYLPVQYTAPPTVDDGFYAVPRWTQTETAIVQEWDVLKDTRPLSAEAVTAMLIAQQINTLAVDDNTALRMTEFYPEWAAGTAYTVGYKVRRNGKLWRVVQAHTAQIGWEPENAASLWEQINETHAGTEDDPIPYSGNMALTAGLYYIHDGVIYLCTRDTVNPVYNPLAELVGIYVETTY